MERAGIVKMAAPREQAPFEGALTAASHEI